MVGEIMKKVQQEQNHSAIDITLDDTKDILRGILIATEVSPGEQTFDNLLGCTGFIAAEVFMLKIAKSLIKEIANGDRDPFDITGTLLGIFLAIASNYAWIQECKALVTGGSWTEFDKIVEATKDPKSFKIIGKNMIFHGLDITSGVYKSVDALKHQDYLNFGKNLGQTIKDAL
jgi:hypothetical protein